MFSAHAYLKIAVLTVPGFIGFLGQAGFPGFLAWPIILVELIGGLAILTVFYTRVVSMVLLPVLLGAPLVHVPNGCVFNAPNGGWEYPTFLAHAAMVQILIGDAAFAMRSVVFPANTAAPLRRASANPAMTDAPRRHAHLPCRRLNLNGGMSWLNRTEISPGTTSG